MMLPKRVGVAVVLAAVLLSCCLGAKTKSKSSKSKSKSSRKNDDQPPHIILIFTDGVRENGYQNPVYYTPTIDALAADGVKFDRHYCGTMCTPSRAQLLTGRHQVRYGLQHDVIRPDTPYGLPLNEVLLPQRLKELGYATHMVGKWHLGSYLKEYTPLMRGFDSFHGYFNGVIHSMNHSVQCPSDGNDWGYDMWDNWDPVEPRLSDGIFDAFIYNWEATRVIDRHDPNKPLFLYFPTHEAHGWPYFMVPEKYVEIYENRTTNENERRYGAKVTVTDDHLKTIVDALKLNGLYENSIIVMASDNGVSKGGLPGGSSLNVLFFDAPTEMSESVLRAPAFIHSPLLPQSVRGRVVTETVSLMDWMPTLLARAGHPHPEAGVEGRDIWDVITKDAPTHHPELLHSMDEEVPLVGVNAFPDRFDTRITAGYRMGDYKLLTGCEQWHPTVYNGQQMRICDKLAIEGGLNYHLYDVIQDPTELQDLASDPSKLPIIHAILDRLKVEQANTVPALKALPASAPTEAACPKNHGGIWKPFNY